MDGTTFQEEIQTIKEQWADQDQVRRYSLWLSTTFFIRRNVYARYDSDGSPACVKDRVSGTLLVMHCTGKQTIGAYTTDPDDDTCIWMGIDIDWHADDAPPDSNEKYAVAKYDELRTLGFDPILEDSNGRGGFHLWVLFSQKIPARDAYSFGHWLIRDGKEYGLKPEVFPKQITIREKYGNQMRLPGKHPKRNHYSRIWDGRNWLEGKDAIDHMIARQPTAPGRIPTEALAFVTAQPAKRVVDPAKWKKYDTADWPKNYNGDLRTLDLERLFEQAGMLGDIVGGVQEVVCPWHDEHTTGDHGTAVWPAKDKQYPGWHCMHGHCEGRTLEDVLAWFGRDKVDACCERMFPTEKDPLTEDDLEALDGIVTGGSVENLADDDLAKYRSDPLYQYLWEGYHGDYVTDDERRRRIESIQKIWEYVPRSGLIPQYIRTVLRTTDAAPIFHLGSALGMAGHLLNRKVGVREGMKWLHPNLWIANVGTSTLGRKSSSINPVAHFLDQDYDFGQTVLSDTFTMEGLYTTLGFVEADDAGIRARREHCEERAKTDENYLRGVGLFHTNEVSILLSNLDKNYNSGGKNLLTDWYDGKLQFLKPTKGQGTYYIWRPCISIVGATTLEWLSTSCTEQDMGGGFLPRWLFFYGGAEKDYHLSNQDTPPDADCQVVLGEIQKLKSVSKVNLDLHRSAMDLYDSWQRQLVKKADDRLASWAGRMITTAKKVALIYELTVDPESRVVGLEAFERATRLIDRLFDDLTHITAFELAFGAQDGKLKKILGIIQRAGEGGIVRSDLMRRVSPMHAWEVQEVVETLAEQRRISVEVYSTTKPGKLYKFIR